MLFDLYALYGESWCNALYKGDVESMVRRGADVVLTSVPSVDVERCHVVLLNRVCEVNVCESISETYQAFPVSIGNMSMCPQRLSKYMLIKSRS